MTNKDHKDNNKKSHHHRAWNNNKFEGSHPQMIGSYYTYNPEQPAMDQYQETTDKLVEVVCSSLEEPQRLKACIKNLKKQAIPEPQLQENGFLTGTTGQLITTTPTSTKQDELKYSIQFKE
mmetsp:Transcript_5508/g.15545  ORF Transcript_5508/g.15545 Transcript_5508/m.15545 type:complete len:121 (-) Transcript_5508:42-404(-)|eukprot:CAMPEP_0168736342 /NCGR_PEP_ID=MMETSP0724-20121128/9811_1 /TAXON_ID=265536 /ORGANISM="Amphiprora sp., Strain CCMP467" /LENGTH=120 /DNA_ID=CAMNT_0008783537 /DNA_START=281 /DNA_END=643 /DNA_ORIENTATION=+